jgi:hypothetical protein
VGTSVTISGGNFGATQDTVTFGGVTSTPTSWSNTSITAPVPNGAATGNIVVTVGGQASTGVSFTVTPKILGLSLPEGPLKMGFVITGTAFGSSQGTSQAKLNGIPMNVVAWSDIQITVQVPDTGTSGPVVVTVNAQDSNNDVSFTVDPPFGCSP